MILKKRAWGQKKYGCRKNDFYENEYDWKQSSKISKNTINILIFFNLN